MPNKPVLKIAKPHIVGGALRGYKCGYDHIHPNQVSAQNCTPDEYAKEQIEANAEAARQQRQRTLDDPRFKEVVAFVARMGPDERFAREVVISAGIDKAVAFKNAYDALQIPIVEKRLVAEKKAAMEKAAAEKTGEGNQQSEQKPPAPPVPPAV